MSLLSSLQKLTQLCGLDSTEVDEVLADIQLDTPSTISNETIDGVAVRRIKTGFRKAADLTIPIGRWTLKLVPTPQDGTTDLFVPVEIRCATSSNQFQQLRITLARLELISDPKVFIAANVEEDPHTYLTEMPHVDGKPVPVVLRGPALTLVFKSSDLQNVSVEFDDGTDAEFPTLGFDPPHFLIAKNGTPTGVGVVCDEVLLDLKRTDNPSIVDERLEGVDDTWRGIVLKEIGIFFGDGTEVGTWSGMANMKNFFLGFDDNDLSGLFSAELVHYSLDSDPQIRVAIFRYEDSNEIEVTDSSDANVPGPKKDKTTVRVRLEAEPNWDSAGYEARWTIPDVASPENPLRVNKLNLGPVRLPPGEHEFTVEVQDDRFKSKMVATRKIIVAQPTGPNSPPSLIAALNAIIDKQTFPDGRPNPDRIHVSIFPGQELDLIARPQGDATTVTATLENFSTTGFERISSTPTANSFQQSLNREQGSSRNFQHAVWTVRAPAQIPPTPSGAFELTVTDGQNTVRQRLRYTIVERPNENAQHFDLVSFLDWRPDPGPVSARLFYTDGISPDDINWRLESSPATDDVLSNSSFDSLFLPSAAFANSENVSISRRNGMIQHFLDLPNRIWRLTGTVNPGTETQTRAIIVEQERVENSVDGPRPSGAFENEVRLFAGDDVVAQRFKSEDGASTRLIVFQHNCSIIQPAPGGPCSTVGPEPTNDQIANTNVEQARGLASLMRAISEFDDQIDEIALFGAASIEGGEIDNNKLSQNRANAIKDLLNEVAEGSDSLDSIFAAQLPPTEQFQITPQVRSRLQSLISSSKIKSKPFGETFASLRVNPWDRHVVPVLRLKNTPIVDPIVRREFFLTLPKAQPKPKLPAVPKQNPQKHPFKHSCFRYGRVEVEFARSELTRVLVRLIVDLEAFNENDAEDPFVTDEDGKAIPRELNALDGLTNIILQLNRNPNPGPDEPKYKWEAAVLSDPRDKDGFALLRKPNDETLLDIIGPPALTAPAMTAISGGEIGVTGFALASGLGTALRLLGILDVRTLIWRGLRLSVRHGGNSETIIRVGVDYTLKYDIDAQLRDINSSLPDLGLTTKKPLEITFRNVGIEFDTTDNDITFFYDPADGFRVDINEPGVFQLGDGIGRLLRVDRTSVGATNPFWIEIELAFSLETGIFEVDKLAFRISIDSGDLFKAVNGKVNLDGSSISIGDLSVNLTKVGVSANVPGVIEGAGSLSIQEDGVAGELELQLVPLSLQLHAGLAIYEKDTFKSVFASVGVDFKPGILLGSTGAAIYGFHGLIGVNMERNNDDALAWFKGPPVGVTQVSKWEPSAGNWAFGVGTVIGTAFDNGYSLDTKGTFIVEIPGPKILLATESQLLSAKPEVKDASGGNLLTVIQLDLENDIFLIGLDFTFRKPNKEPHLLEFRVPAEFFVNMKKANDWHLRFGQWEPIHKRIRATIFGLWKVWGYLVLEGDGTKIVAPDTEYQGITFATGGRTEVTWGSKKFNLYLVGWFEFHVGVQIDPLLVSGSVKVGGEIHLLVISIGASGKLRVIAPDPFVIQGEVCGEIDLWLTSIKKCVDFRIGDERASLPAPQTPLKSIDLVDRLTSAALDDTSEVPLDAVIHLNFDYDIFDKRNEPASQFGDNSTFRNQISTELFYDFELTDLEISPPVTLSDGSRPPEAWAPYTLKNGSTEEANSARTLRVLSWVPHSHERAVDFSRGYGESLVGLFERICDDPIELKEQCAGFDSQILGPGHLWKITSDPLSPVTVIATEPSLSTENGSQPIATNAEVVPMISVKYPERFSQDRCLRLPPKFEGDSLDIQEVVDSLPSIVDDPFSDLSRKIWERGIVLISLPQLVAASMTLAINQERKNGHVVFLDEFLSPVSQIKALSNPADAPQVPDFIATSQFAAHAVQRVDFGPASPSQSDPDIVSWVLIAPPAAFNSKRLDRYAYLMEICGITFHDFQLHRDQVLQKTKISTLLNESVGVGGGSPTLTEIPLLNPGQTYQVNVSLRWKRFSKRDQSTSIGEGNLAQFSQSFTTASSHPQDIENYVLTKSPHDALQPHYFGSDVRLWFRSQGIDRLFEKFGKQLVIRAESHLGNHILNQPMQSRFGSEFFAFDGGETIASQALNELNEKCLSGDFEQLWIKNTFSLTDEPLLPNTGYTISVIPRDIGEPNNFTEEEWNALLQQDFLNNRSVYRFEIRTSRYESFAAHIAEYKDRPTGDIVIDDFDSLLLTLDEISVPRSDLAVETVSEICFGGPVSIPDEPEIARLWASRLSQDSDLESDELFCCGVLLDGPEPLLKTQENGNPRVQLEVKAIPLATTPHEEGMPIQDVQLIVGQRGSRVLVFFGDDLPQPFLSIRLTSDPIRVDAIPDHKSPNNGPVEIEQIAISVGDSPGSFLEDGDQS